jgi:rRNA maturation endonuclease Nob1
MSDSHIQYAGGYQKDNISKADIEKAIKDIQLMDDEHGAFWVSVITVDENVIEVNKDLSLSAIFEGDEIKYQANDWNEVNELYSLLLKKEFHEVKQRLMKTQHYT